MRGTGRSGAARNRRRVARVIDGLVVNRCNACDAMNPTERHAELPEKCEFCGTAFARPGVRVRDFMRKTIRDEPDGSLSLKLGTNRSRISNAAMNIIQSQTLDDDQVDRGTNQTGGEPS